MTSAPCRPSCSAAALPIPEVAPVTRAVTPWSSRCSLIVLVLPCRDLRAAGRASLAEPAAISPAQPAERVRGKDQLNGFPSARFLRAARPRDAVTQSAPVLAWPLIPHLPSGDSVIRTCAPGVVMSPAVDRSPRFGRRLAADVSARPSATVRQCCWHARQTGLSTRPGGLITRLSRVMNTRASNPGVGGYGISRGLGVTSSRIEPFCAEDQPVRDGGDGG